MESLLTFNIFWVKSNAVRKVFLGLHAIAIVEFYDSLEIEEVWSILVMH